MGQITGKADWQEVFSDRTDPQPKLVQVNRWGTKKVSDRLHPFFLLKLEESVVRGGFEK